MHQTFGARGAESSSAAPSAASSEPIVARFSGAVDKCVYIYIYLYGTILYIYMYHNRIYIY